MKRPLPCSLGNFGVIEIWSGPLSCRTSSQVSLIMVNMEVEDPSRLLTKIDHFAESTYRMMNLSLAQQRDVKSLQNWLDGSGNVARAERSYLLHHRELVSLTPAEDSAIAQLEVWVEDRFIQWWRGFRKVRRMCEVSWRADNGIARLS